MMGQTVAAVLLGVLPLVRSFGPAVLHITPVAAIANFQTSSPTPGFLPLG